MTEHALSADPFLRPSQVKQILNVSDSTLIRLARSRSLVPIKFGASNRYRTSAVEAFIAKAPEAIPATLPAAKPAPYQPTGRMRGRPRKLRPAPMPADDEEV